MGVWGTGIFQDDVAADARDEYREHLQYGLDGHAATDKVLETLATNDAKYVDPSVWLGLAAAQASLGRLEGRVKDRALEIIADGSDLSRWADEGAKLLASRRRVLHKLEKKLLGPQRAPVTIRRRRPAVSE